MTRDAACKKVEIAIDKIIDLQDGGYGSEETASILDMLYDLLSRISRGMI